MKQLWIVLFTLITCTGCTMCEHDPTIFIPHTLNENSKQVYAFGHGGMGEQSLIATDSKEGFQKVIQVGGDGSDIDIQMSMDSVLIAFHDDQMSTSSTGEGFIIENTAEQCTSEHFKTIGREQVRTVIDILSYLPQDNYFSFDLKLQPGNTDRNKYMQTFMNALIYTIDHCHPRAIIECEDKDFCLMLHAARPDYKIFFYPDFDDFDAGYEFVVQNGLFGITISNNHISDAQVDKAHAAGKRIIIYETKNSKDNLNAFMKSPEFIETDALRDLVDVCASTTRK